MILDKTLTKDDLCCEYNMKEDSHDSEDRKTSYGFLGILKYWIFTGVSKTIIFIILSSLLVWGVGAKTSEKFNMMLSSFIVGDWEEAHIIGSEVSKPYREFWRITFGDHPYTEDHFNDMKLTENLREHLIDSFVYVGDGLIVSEKLSNDEHLIGTNSCTPGIICDFPITEIDRNDAVDFCDEIGARIPTYEELYPLIKSRTRSILSGLSYYSDFMEWTSSSNGILSDDYRIITKGLSNSFIENGYLDDDDGSMITNLGFRCVIDVPKEG